MAAKVLFPYASTECDELILRKNEVLEVLKKEEEDWWRCRNSLGEEGLAPRNYLEVLTLPSGWKTAMDEESGDEYYYNVSTGDVQWEFPIGDLSPQISDIHEQHSNNFSHLGQEDSKKIKMKNKRTENTKDNSTEEDSGDCLPPGWSAHTDEGSGDVFYHHESSGETTWDIPKHENMTRIKKRDGDFDESNGDLSSLRRMREEANDKIAVLRNAVDSENDNKSGSLHASSMNFGKDTNNIPCEESSALNPKSQIHDNASRSSQRPSQETKGTRNDTKGISEISLDRINKMIAERVEQELFRREQDILAQVEVLMREKLNGVSENNHVTPNQAESKKTKRKKQQAVQDTQQLSSRSAGSEKTTAKKHILNKSLSHPDLLQQEGDNNVISPLSSLEPSAHDDNHESSSTSDSLFPALQSKGSGSGMSKQKPFHAQAKKLNENSMLPPLVSPKHTSPERKSVPHVEEFQSAALNTIILPESVDESTPGNHHKEEAEGNLILKHVHSYDGNGGTGKNIHWLNRSVIVYPAVGLVVLMNVNNAKQQFYRAHTNEVTCLSVHPNKQFIVSGQLGKEGRILVWDSSLLFHKKHEQQSLPGNVMAGQEQLTPEKNVIKELYLERTKGVLGASFSGDGRLVVAIGMHESSPVVIFDWNRGATLASISLGHADIFQVGFNPFLYNNQVDTDNDISLDKKHCYTLVSCGSRHVKFWSLRRVCEQVGAGAPKKVRAGGFKGRQLAVPKNKQKWEWKYTMEGNTGNIPKKQTVHAVEMTCFTSIPEPFVIGKHALPQSKILTGASNGCVYIWKQLEVSRENADDDGYMYWLPRGTLLCVVSDVHDGPLYDIDHLSLNAGDQSITPSHMRIATCSKDGTVNLWELNIGNPSGDKSPMEHISVVNIAGSDSCLGNPRSISFNADGSGMAVGTSHNCICTIGGLDMSRMGDSEGDGKNIRLHTIVSANYGKGRHVAAHPFMDIFATVASDKTLRLWSVKSAAQVAYTRIGHCGSSLTFTPDGATVAVGTETGEILLLTCTYLQFCRENDAEPALDQNKPQWDILGRKFVGSKGANNPGKRDVTKTEITAMKYSPGGDILAVATRDKNIHLLSAVNGYKRSASCKGHSGAISSLDFSDDGILLQSSDCIRETLFWETATGKMMSDIGRAHASQWVTWSNLIGPSMQGVCNGANPLDSRNHLDPSPQNLSSLVAAASRSNDSRSVVVAGSGQMFHQHCLKLFKYPCSAEAVSKEYLAHTSAIGDTCFLNSDRYVVSMGGNDSSLLVWVHR